MDLNDYERRLKKLVYDKDYISVWQVVESFKTHKAFEDIDNTSSMTLCLMTSEFLQKDHCPDTDQSLQTSNSQGNDFGASRGHENDGGVIRSHYAHQSLFIPYLMLLGIFYCKASTRAKASKFYQLIQMDLTPHVSCGDKELAEYFKQMLKIATLLVVEQFQICYLSLADEEQ